MVLKYTWLKILELMKKRGSKITVRDLRSDLDERGFRIDPKELGEDLGKLRELGLIESDLLVTADGTATILVDDYTTIGITAAGLRKLSAIVKI